MKLGILENPFVFSQKINSNKIVALESLKNYCPSLIRELKKNLTLKL